MPSALRDPRNDELVDSLERRPLLETPFMEAWPAVSPDGRWIAYTSMEAGRGETYVASFPDLAGRKRVSLEGGRQDLEGGRLRHAAIAVKAQVSSD